jgi:hypothetical protein
MQVKQGNGCYTNVGFQNYTTRRINTNQNVVVVELSLDSKIGKMSATHAPQTTCPPLCPLYPKTINDIHKIERDRLATQLAEEEAYKIDALTASRNCRVHIVGDCQTVDAARIVGGAMARYEKRSPNGKVAYTYTHAWRDVPYSAWQGARVIASCETKLDIYKARSNQGYLGTEYTYMKHLTHKVHIRNGVKVLPCPNQFNKAVTCDKCMVCANVEMLNKHGLTIGLSAHGATRQVERQLALV